VLSQVLVILLVPLTHLFVQGNILVDETGSAIITDFGLSKVLEEMSDSMSRGTSFFAGSTRWMAPELIFALVEDDGVVPPITTYSDVYAFASICLEVSQVIFFGLWIFFFSDVLKLDRLRTAPLPQPLERPFSYCRHPPWH
jgi:serine/threonine protein kinase